MALNAIPISPTFLSWHVFWCIPCSPRDISHLLWTFIHTPSTVPTSREAVLPHLSASSSGHHMPAIQLLLKKQCMMFVSQQANYGLKCVPPQMTLGTCDWEPVWKLGLHK